MNLSFGQALEALKSGKRVARSSWKPGSYVWCDLPTRGLFADGATFNPQLAGINVSSDGFRRYEPTNADLFAENWHIVNSV